MALGTPRGFRDVLPEEALEREAIADHVRKVFSQAGYVPVETPLLESREVLERAGRLRGVPFQLFDTDDALLMLRPELTLPIARLAASRLDLTQAPIRLRYQAPVVREQARGHGLPRQLTQMGVELIGGQDGACEVEVMDLLASTLGELGVARWTLAVGSVRPLQALLALPGVPPQLADTVSALVHRSDLVGVSEAVTEAEISQPLAQAISQVVRLCGGCEVLDELEALLAQAGVSAHEGGMEELRTILGSLGDEARDHLIFDFSLANAFDYYTGVIFKAYAPGLAGSLASGGRYDAILANLSVPAVGAAGFAFSLERLQEALESPGAERPLRIAVPKGSLRPGALEALKGAGLSLGNLAHPDRQLLLRVGDVEFIIVRASDAPVFVAYGGADCGLCGSDSLVEAGLDLVTLVNLRFGGCRFVVAAPEASASEVAEAIERCEPLQVASKYPSITSRYFEKRGVSADVIALHGNIELAPLVGMARCIVDITDTGKTLEKNHLVEVETVMDCSARFFASPAACRSDPRVRDLASALEAWARTQKKKKPHEAKSDDESDEATACD